MSDETDFPADWMRAAIKEIVDPSRAITYGIVQPGRRFDSEHGIPMIRGQDYSSGTVRTEGLYHVDPRLAASFSRASVRGGDLLMSIVGYVGTTAEVPNNLDGANLTQTTARIALRPDLKSRYFLHFLRSAFFRREVARFTKGSAQPGLNLADVEIMRVAYPRDLLERAAIAEVLDTLDATIRQTEAIIEKLKLVKQGLLHDLLTRGIDANGELRPPQSQAPHLYKDSPLGWIPVDWRVGTVNSEVDVIDPNPSHRYPVEQQEGVPICSTENFDGEDGFDLAQAKQMPQSVYIAQRRRCDFLPDDVVFARKGRIGLARRYGDEAKVFSHTVVMLKSRSAAIDQKWILWLARSSVFLGGIRQRMNSNSGVPTLGVELIGSIVVPIPPANEQSQASEVMDQLSARVHAETKNFRALNQLKLGLMDDLLTGRVRVTPLLEANSAPA
ncbi:MAG: restriction endonuclease subunit S [Lysobacterales bacterium]